MSHFKKIVLFVGLATLWVAGAQTLSLMIETFSVPFGVVGTSYSATISSTGGASTTWTVAGSFPPGIGFGSTTGSSITLTGTPTAAGDYTFTLTATDPAQRNATGSMQFTLSVAQISPPPPLPAATVNAAYSVTFTISAQQSFNWSVSNPPPGLTMSPQGTLSGTPNTTGTFGFSVTAAPFQVDFARSPQDAPGRPRSSSPAFINGPVTAQYQLTVAPPLTFTTSVKLPNGVAGLSYSFALGAMGGTPPYNFTLEPSGAVPNVLPANLDLKAGVITGIPTTAGDYGFAIDVVDGNGVTTAAFMTLIIAPPLLITTASPLPTAAVQSAYTQSIAASGGNTPYTFSLPKGSALPAGLTLQPSGAFTGTPTAAGPFSFTVQVTDNFGYVATKPFQLTVAAAGPLLQVSPLLLSFSGAAGDTDSPPTPQIVSIVAPSGALVNFAAQIQNAAPVPGWITISPTTGSTPAGLKVTVSSIISSGSSTTTLSPGTYTAAIPITVPGNTGQAAITVQVSFIVTPKPSLLVLPSFLQFGARSSAPSTQEQLIEVEDTGGGGAVTATIVGKSAWLTLPQSTGATVRVDVNSQGLSAGDFHDIVRLTNSAGTADVAVSLFVSPAGPILSLSESGTTFHSRQGAGLTDPETIGVLNLGDPTSTVNWTVDLVTGSDWLTISGPASGTATPAQPGTFKLVPAASIANLPSGPLYALVRVADPLSQSSPQYLTAVLDNQPATAPALPDPGPAGLFFLPTTGAQSVVVSTSSTTAVAFQASAVTVDGAAWLSVTPATGTASTATPGQLSVSVATSALAPGIYHGSINIAMNGALRIVNITLVVPSTTTPPPAFRTTTAAATGVCAPAHLAITQTGLANNFAIPAGWPATLIVQLNDDCGNPVSNGSVVASFSNGDPPLTLPGDHTTNIYSSTWQPGTVFPEMTVTVQASANALPQAVQQFTGGVNQNNTPPPSLLANGALNIFFDNPTANAAGRALAPGGVVQIYGNGLAPSLTSPGVVPLLNAISGTFMLIGKYQVPLFFVAGQLVAAQVPFEVTPNQQYPAIASVNNALTLPETLSIVALQPGVLFNISDQTVIAQRPLTGELVSASKPAIPGEILTVYLAGMGATDLAVPTGTPTPLQQVKVSVQPIVTLDNEQVNVGYAGLTPTGIGLYQINFTVPLDARAGLLDLVITQGTVQANTTKLIVGSK